MSLLFQLIFWLIFSLSFQGLTFAGNCEMVFSDPNNFRKAMTEGLSLKEGQNSLFEFYRNNSYPYPRKGEDRFLQDVFEVLHSHPELSKPALREYKLEFSIKERENPKSLKTFIRSLTRSAGQSRNNLFQISDNIGFWMKMIDFPTLTTSFPNSSFLQEGTSQLPTSLNKEEKKALKQKQKDDFIAWLNSTALNEKTRDFIKDTSNPYRERLTVLYKAMEEIRNTYLADISQNSQTPVQGENLEADKITFQERKNSQTPIQNEKSEGNTRAIQDRESRQKKTVQRIGQAMAELVHTAGFGNSTYTVLLKSSNPSQSYSALSSILNERDIVAFDLGFEGHFAEMKKSLNANISEDIQILEQIEADIQNEPYIVKGKNILRLRALSLQESPFRSCLAGDCATDYYFEKAFDPNFLYWTLTDAKHNSSGHITVVLGRATNKKDQDVKTAFVDKIQNVSTEHILPMLEGIRLSLKEKGYILALPQKVGDLNGLSNEPVMGNYVKSKILAKAQNSLKAFKPHTHSYPFENLYSRSDEQLDLWEFEPVKLEGVEITPGEVHNLKSASPSVSVHSLYAEILSLKDSRVEEEQIKFLDNLPTISQTKELNLPEEYVTDHLDFVLQDRSFSFLVRKKALFAWIKFNVLNQSLSYPLNWLEKKANSFSDQEVTNIIGEMSNWENSTGYRKTFITALTIRIGTIDIELENLNRFKSLVDSRGWPLLDKGILLHKAIEMEKTDIKVVQELLKMGANPNIMLEGHTALTLASKKGLEEVVHLLLEKEADVHAKTNREETALTLATKKGHTNIVGQLLEKGADINTINEEEETPLMLAIQKRYTDIMYLLLEKGANVNLADYRGWNALLLTIEYYYIDGLPRAKIDMIKSLLERGADIHAVNNEGETALMIAGRDIPTADFLLEKGADINAVNFQGQTALMSILERDYYYNYQQDIKTINFLLEKGADINAVNHEGENAFMLAVRGKKPEQYLDFFLEKGVDINAVNHKGENAFMLALQTNKSKNYLNFLLNRGADIHAVNKDGENAFMLAVRRDNPKLNFLLEKGADINAVNKDGENAFMLAVRRKKPKNYLNFLLNRGADINAINNKGETALILAFQDQDKYRIEHLLKEGADMNIQTKEILYHSHIKSIQQEIISLLQNSPEPLVLRAISEHKILPPTVENADSAIRFLSEKSRVLFEENKDKKSARTPLFSDSLMLVKYYSQLIDLKHILLSEIKR